MLSGWYINFLFSCALEGLLCYRASRANLWAQYPLFYIYVIYTAARSVAFAFPTVTTHSNYARIFWWTYLLAAVLRLGIAVEIQRHVFPRHSPLRGRANVIVLLTLVSITAVFWMIGPGPGASVFPDVMRTIAFSVAAWILVLFGLARYYEVRVGRNMLGMAVGILLFTGSELVYLSAMDLVPSFWSIWRDFHPFAFVFMLIVWTGALWRYHPVPPTPVLNESLSQQLINAWRERWTQVPNLVRRVGKP